MNARLPTIVLTVLFIIGTLDAWAKDQNLTIEQVAQTIAEQHNANSNGLKDEMTVSSRAFARGKDVRFENILRVKKGLPQSKLQEFGAETRREIIPAVCQLKGNEIGFKRGLSYTFSYLNTYGEKLTEFTVNAGTCGINP